MTDTKPEANASLNIYQKLAAITGEIGVVAKDGKNAEQKYAFIEYAAVAGKLRTLFAKYGVVIVPRIKSQERTEITSKYGAKGFHTLAKLEFQVVNADDPSDHFTVEWESEAADYGDKATNKAATAALKYYEMRQFNISEKGEDADNVTPELEKIEKPAAPKPAVGSAPQEPATISAAQMRKMQAMYNELGISERDAKLRYASETIKRPLESSRDLTRHEAVQVIDRLDDDYFEVMRMEEQEAEAQS